MRTSGHEQAGIKGHQQPEQLLIRGVSMGKDRFNYSKAMSAAIIHEATLGNKKQIARTEIHNSMRDEYAHKKPEIALSKKFLKAALDAYGYCSWDKMNTVEKCLYLGLFFLPRPVLF